MPKSLRFARVRIRPRSDLTPPHWRSLAERERGGWAAVLLVGEGRHAPKPGLGKLLSYSNEKHWALLNEGMNWHGKTFIFPCQFIPSFSNANEKYCVAEWSYETQRKAAAFRWVS